MGTSWIVRGGRVLVGVELVRADVLIEDDRIAAVGPVVAAPEGARELDATGRLVLPGLVNAHTHAASHLARGRAGNWTLEDLLVYAPANAASRSPDDEYLSTAIGAIEMLKTGCTAAYDLYMAIPAITDEAMEAVVRAIITDDLTDAPASQVIDREGREKLQDKILKDLKKKTDVKVEEVLFPDVTVQ